MLLLKLLEPVSRLVCKVRPFLCQKKNRKSTNTINKDYSKVKVLGFRV